jgi:hypothetical protein
MMARDEGRRGSRSPPERPKASSAPTKDATQMTKTAFFAYPAEPQFLGDAIQEAILRVRSANDLIITPWTKLNIIGLKLDNLIRERLAGADFILADVTYPNFNVYYEIGYAAGQQKPFVLTVNYAIEQASAHANLTGLFDTVGQLRYQNSGELVERLANYEGYSWTNEYLKDKDHAKPLFFLSRSGRLISEII